MTDVPGAPISRAAFLAAAAGVLLAACGSGSEPRSGGTAAAPVTTEPPAEPHAAWVVPASLIGARTIDGDVFDADGLAGRPTVAWFWAPWCAICRGEAPDVADIAARYADRVNVVGVAGRGEVSDMRAFVSDTGTAAITHLDDGSGEIWAAYEIFAQPAFAFITVDGRVETHVGSLGADELTRRIDQLVGT